MDNIKDNNITMTINDEEVTTEAPPKKNNSKKSSTTTKKVKEEVTTEYKIINYKVILDIDKDLDLLLICAILNKNTKIHACVENGDTISCGIYSDYTNALKCKSNIEDLGYKVVIQEV